MEEVVIRKIRSSDISKIERLAMTDDYFSSQVITISSSFLSQFHRKYTWVALHKKTIVGFIYAGLLLEKTLIPHFMFVMPSWRKKGIGAKLLQTAEMESGCTSSLIYYHKSLHDFYEQQGYIYGTELEVALKPLKGGNAV